MGSPSPDRLPGMTRGIFPSADIVKTPTTKTRRGFLAGSAAVFATLTGALPAGAQEQPVPAGLPATGTGPKDPAETAGVLLAPERMVAGGLEINNFVPGGHGVIYDTQAESIIAEKVGDRRIIINVTQTGQPTEGYGNERTPTHNWYDLRAPEIILPAGSVINGYTLPKEKTDGSIKYGEATMNIRPDGALEINYNLGSNYESFVNGALTNLPVPDTAEFAQRRKTRASRDLSEFVMGFLGDRIPNSSFYWLGTNFASPREDLEVLIEPNPLLQLV